MLKTDGATIFGGDFSHSEQKFNDWTDEVPDQLEEDSALNREEIFSNSEAQEQAAAESVVQEAAKTDATALDKQTMPLSTFSFFVTQLSLLVPPVNLVLMLVWAFRAKTNANRKAYARASLIWFLAGCVAALSGLTAMLFLRWPISLNFWFLQFRDFIGSIEGI